MYLRFIFASARVSSSRYGNAGSFASGIHATSMNAASCLVSSCGWANVACASMAHSAPLALRPDSTTATPQVESIFLSRWNFLKNACSSRSG